MKNKTNDTDNISDNKKTQADDIKKQNREEKKINNTKTQNRTIKMKQ